MMRRKPAFSFDDWTGRPPAAPEHVCDKEGCRKAGEFRAPKDRTLSDYYWFCLEHVREYNAQWDFYQGMSPLEIEEELKQDVCWQRPTWKLGERAGIDPTMFADPLGIKKEAFGDDADPAASMRARASASHMDPALVAAAKVLEVGFPLDLKDVRRSYKRLAKLYHPDSNGGDKASEEKFKDVTQAYRLIVSVLDVKRQG